MMDMEKKIANGELVPRDRDGCWISREQLERERSEEAALYLLGFEPGQAHSFRWFMDGGGFPHFDIHVVRLMSRERRRAEHTRLKRDHPWLKTLAGNLGAF